MPLGSAVVVRPDDDLTIVATAAMVQVALDAAEQLSAFGTSVEVVDPRTLSPLDTDTICSSVAKTGRLIIVDESPPRCSIATDIAATVGEQLFDQLRAPIRRVTAPHSPVPLSPPLENAYIPSVEQVLAAVSTL